MNTSEKHRSTTRPHVFLTLFIFDMAMIFYISRVMRALL